MIITMALTNEATNAFLKAGKVPDFKKISQDIDGVELIKVFGRSRYADIEVTEAAFKTLKQKFSNDFLFSKKRFGEPFVIS